MTAQAIPGECSRHGTARVDGCFRCKTLGVSLSFRYGKAQFHGPTYGEQQRRTIEQSKAAGTEMVPVGERWV